MMRAGLFYTWNNNPILKYVVIPATLSSELTRRDIVVEHMPEANIDANSTQGMRLPILFEHEDLRSSNKGTVSFPGGQSCSPR